MYIPVKETITTLADWSQVIAGVLFFGALLTAMVIFIIGIIKLTYQGVMHDEVFSRSINGTGDDLLQSAGGPVTDNGDNGGTGSGSHCAHCNCKAMQDGTGAGREAEHQRLDQQSGS